MPAMNSPHTPPSLGQWIRRILITGAVLLVLFLAGARWNLRRQVNAELDRIRAAGQPVTLEELARRHADLGDRRDASAELAAAIAGLQGAWENLFTNTFDSQLVADDLPLMGKGPKLGVVDSIPPGFTNSVSIAMSAMTPAFDQLGQVLAEPNAGFRNPIAITDGFEMLLPHLSEFKQLGQWHALRTVWQLDRGEDAAAVETTVNLLRLSRVLETEPTLISQLLRLAVVRIALTSIERLASRSSLAKEQLQQLRAELALARPDRSIHEGMLGERCIGLDIMHFRSRSLADLTDPDGKVGRSFSPGDALMVGYRMTGLADRDTLFYLGILNAGVTAGTNSAAARLDYAASVGAQSPGRFAIFSRILIPALGKAFQKEADCLTAVAAAEAALAVEAWRAANAGRIPGSLTELVPEFFPEVPVDPATERPLTLVPAAAGYAIHGNGPLFTVRR